MQIAKHKLLMVLILFSPFAFSNEGSKTDVPANENYSGKQDQSWEAVQTSLTALKGKVEAQAAVVQGLIVEKNHLKGEALAAKIEEIKKQHQKYEQLVFDYNKQNEDFLTRYPERGLKEKRIYKRVKMKSLDSFEDEYTLRGKMNKLHKKVLKQYPGANKVVDEKSEGSRLPAKPNESAKDVTDSIQFKK